MAAAIFEQPIGQALKHYQIVSLLGEGQMGPVFKARDLTRQRDVALKVFSAHVTAQPGFHERFPEAARTAARLEHPNIVKVLDFGWDRAVPFLVMEYLPGDTLRRMMLTLQAQQRWMTLAEAVAIARQVALALDHALRQGRLHLRVQPSDIMFRIEAGDGLAYRPVLTDLGLASLTRGALTYDDGSPDSSAYRSPEQARGDSTDARSDVYSLGVLLHKLTVGQLPFPAATGAEGARAPSHPPPPPRSIRPELPESLERIVLKALAPNPADRFASAAEVADALGQTAPALADLPTGDALSLRALFFQGDAAPTPPPAVIPPPEAGRLFQVGGLSIDPDQIQFSPGLGWVGVYTDLPHFSIEPGHTLTLRLVVFNRGPQADRLSMSVTGVPSAWLSPLPPGVSVPAGDQQILKFVLHPPRLPNTRAGRYPLTVQVTSRNDASQSAEVRLTLTVTAFFAFRSALNPPRLRPGERGQVAVQNLGNTPETYRLTWQAEADELDFELAKTDLAVPEGQTAVAEFSARPKRTPLVGDVRTHPFTARIAAPAGPAQTQTGAVVSQGLISVASLVFLLVLVCVLSTGMAGLIYADDASREAVATQTASAAQTGVAVADSDEDGLANLQEVEQGTDPLKPDTDGDGLRDGDEQKWGADPLVVDTDADGLLDGQEALELGTSPVNPDTDGDGLNDGVDPDPGQLPTATLVPLTPTATAVPSLTPLPSATPLPTATPLPSLTPLPATPTSPPPPATQTPPPPAPSATPSLSAQPLLFESRRDGNPELYGMAADGSQQTRLTNNLAEDTRPVWSPDGAQIAFESRRDGNWEIYVMAADGSRPTRLTSNSTPDAGPVWSPDGRRLAFESERDGNLEIYVMAADGSGQTRLTDNAVTDCCLAWSPDGTQIAFYSERDGRSGLYLLNVADSQPTWLTDSARAAPVWSPDGTRLAFVWDPDRTAAEIHTINRDGSGLARLTTDAAQDSSPRWSPDSTRLAFVSDRDGNAEVYLMNADGSAQTRLTNHAAAECCLLWSPDGARLAFASDRDGNQEIYLVNTSGTGLVRLTANAAYDVPFAWRP